MPIWLRKFTFKKLQDYYAKQNEQIASASKGKNSNKTTLVDSSGNVNKEAAKQMNPTKVHYK